MYSEMLESYQTILASSNISAEQKSSSQAEISNINSQKNAIMIAENLIKNKGFEDVVIFANNGSISVVVRAEKLEEAEKYELIHELLSPNLNAMFVTPKDIDEAVKRLSYTVSEGLNIAFIDKEIAS